MMCTCSFIPNFGLKFISTFIMFSTLEENDNETEIKKEEEKKVDILKLHVFF